MRLFHLYRVEDLSGVSGTGPVVEGVEFTNGWCALRWMSKRSTLCFYQSIEDVRQIHGHEGRTELILHDFEPLPPARGAADSARLELFLEVVEGLSAAVNLAEDPESWPGSSEEELKRMFAEVQESMERLRERTLARAEARAVLNKR